MKLILRINNKPVKEWPVILPPPDITLNDQENFELREEIIQAILFEAKEECADLISELYYEFEIQAVAFIQPRNINSMEFYRFEKQLKELAPVIKLELPEYNKSKNVL